MKDYRSCPNLIVMLTHNDFTSDNAEKIFEKCKNTKAKYWDLRKNRFPKIE